MTQIMETFAVGVHMFVCRFHIDEAWTVLVPSGVSIRWIYLASFLAVFFFWIFCFLIS